MSAEIFDTHAHYTSHRFDADRTAVLQALPAGGACSTAVRSASKRWEV